MLLSAPTRRRDRQRLAQEVAQCKLEAAYRRANSLEAQLHELRASPQPAPRPTTSSSSTTMGEGMRPRSTFRADAPVFYPRVDVVLDALGVLPLSVSPAVPAPHLVLTPRPAKVTEVFDIASDPGDIQYDADWAVLQAPPLMEPGIVRVPPGYENLHANAIPSARRRQRAKSRFRTTGRLTTRIRQDPDALEDLPAIASEVRMVLRSGDAFVTPHYLPHPGMPAVLGEQHRDVRGLVLSVLYPRSVFRAEVQAFCCLCSAMLTAYLVHYLNDGCPWCTLLDTVDFLVAEAIRWLTPWICRAVHLWCSARAVPKRPVRRAIVGNTFPSLL